MDAQNPTTPDELAEALRSAAAAGRSIRLGGHFSKDAMAGPAAPADVTVSTRCLTRVLQYEPRDLTISVEAGLPFAELTRLLAGERQMVPLDPPFFADATVGGVVAANTSGPRRRLYGTARDFVIGMKFATLEGKLVQSGGMVVKNVAGLDMAKLLIGSFGTLAAVAVVNFKLVPIPAFTRTFLLRFMSPAAAMAARDAVLRGVLQPAALDLLNARAATRLGREGWLVAIQAGGNAAVIDRYTREISEAEILDGEAEEQFWARVREFTPEFLSAQVRGAVVRCSLALSQLGTVLEAIDAPVLARAGSGVCYACFSDPDAAAAWLREATRRGWKTVIEFAPPEEKQRLELWPAAGDDLEIMMKVKGMFDPCHLLNRGRMYGRF